MQQVKKLVSKAALTLNNLYGTTRASLTLNNLYDTTCMTHNRFSNFHCAYTIIQVVHTEFIKVVCTEEKWRRRKLEKK